MEFVTITKAEFIRRMTVGSVWEFADVSDKPITPRTTERIVIKASAHQIVFKAGEKNSYLTFYKGDECKACDNVLRITPGMGMDDPNYKRPTIQYTPKA